MVDIELHQRLLGYRVQTSPPKLATSKAFHMHAPQIRKLSGKRQSSNQKKRSDRRDNPYHRFRVFGIFKFDLNFVWMPHAHKQVSAAEGSTDGRELAIAAAASTMPRFSMLSMVGDALTHTPRRKWQDRPHKLTLKQRPRESAGSATSRRTLAARPHDVTGPTPPAAVSQADAAASCAAAPPYPLPP
ncbi:MAG: hypothetical protein H0T75_07705 [Rhizobiales bacterium]|nr:hypothetical protein [Hyphomicrobiales bacterium]MDQ3558928.1 hypothetical protein [Pseudomonadota bacterium]